jgi:hypothetical protein
MSQTLLFLQCEGCGHAVVAVVDHPPDAVNFWLMGATSSPGNIVHTYPAAAALQCPADVPPQVARAYLSGLDNLSRKDGSNAAAIMFRRAIELAVKAINPDAPKGDNLKRRISALAPDVATPAMKAWAQQIRLDGNDAVHDEGEFSEQDAEKLHLFTQMFLTYAFTLPNMLKRAQEPPA